MPNGARHALGALVGIAATGVAFGLLLFASDRAMRIYRYWVMGGDDKASVILPLLAVGVLLGLAAGSRLSPLASLIPGVVYTLIGLFAVLSPQNATKFGHDVLGSGRIQNAYLTVTSTGLLLVVGALLIVASLPPSRWRALPRLRPGVPPGARPPVAPGGYYGEPQPGVPNPYGPPAPRPGPADAPQPYAPFGGPPPAPQLPPPSRPDAPEPYGPPPGAAPNPPGARRDAPDPYGPPNPPAARPDTPKPADDDDDEPGEWTRMYGGGR
ncbi:hypothetical protein [Actinomadura atramentaria]|uniref:hypothetical protein n=1 Tax=Actinomadura atramentaria TaxID=1990 RepID=UPI00039DFF86|nr:hypothetical protein [Actinomadura atramentaria]